MCLGHGYNVATISTQNMNDTDEVEVARSAYTKERPLYERLATEAHDILKTKLQEAGIAPASIISRAKDIDSFVSKITRKGYTDPLLRTTDLAGIPRRVRI